MKTVFFSVIFSIIKDSYGKSKSKLRIVLELKNVKQLVLLIVV